VPRLAVGSRRGAAGDRQNLFNHCLIHALRGESANRVARCNRFFNSGKGCGSHQKKLLKKIFKKFAAMQQKVLAFGSFIPIIQIMLQCSINVNPV
jgi:hypothetical protein